MIHIVFGPQGAGKSTYSQKLAKEKLGIYFSIDAWMWNLFGNDLPKSMNLKWIKERVSRCEKMIWENVQQISKHNIDVVLDLGFTKFEKRELFYSLADDHQIPKQVHILNAPYNLRKMRVQERNADKGETFNFVVTPEMFDFMEGEFEVPRDKELKEAILIETDER